MKYIDAEKLIAEIKRRIENWTIRGEHSPAGQGRDTCESRVTELSDLLSFAASLQQEQPKQKKNCNDCPHCVDRKDQFGWHFKGCFGGPYNGKFIAEIDECPLQQEQPSFPSNLDEAAEKYAIQGHENHTNVNYINTYIEGKRIGFIAGAEWQKEQDDTLVDIIYQQGIEKGKDEMRETLKKKEK